MRQFWMIIGLMTATSFGAIADEPKLTIVGHRGWISEYPENTLAGFRACWRHGVAVELDVRRTKDGHLVVLHDATVDRTTLGKGPVAEMTLAEVKKLDAAARSATAFENEKVPTLREVFEQMAKFPNPVVGIAVDLKIDDGKVEADVVKLAEELKVLDRLVFIGTAIEKSDVRKRLREADPSTHICCLGLEDKLEAAITDPHSDWVYLRFVPTPKQLGAIHDAKKKLFLSGPLFAKKELENWKKGIDAGADAMLTDFPIELRDVLKPKK